jgi:hypothetical protein
MRDSNTLWNTTIKFLALSRNVIPKQYNKFKVKVKTKLFMLLHIVMSGIYSILQCLLEQKQPLSADGSIEFYTPSEWLTVSAVADILQPHNELWSRNTLPYQ